MFFETRMMLLSPVPLMFGPAGSAWRGLLIASLLVRIVFGVVLRLLARRWVRDRGIPSGINRGIRNALQIIVEIQLPVFQGHVGRTEIECLEIGLPPMSVIGVLSVVGSSS